MMNTVLECNRPRWPFQRRSAAWLPTLTLCLFGILLPARAQDPRLTNTNNPLDRTASMGATVNFVLYAASTNGPMTFQWQHEGTNLPSATNVSLVLVNVTLTNAGRYQATIWNAGGDFTNTRTATLTLYPTFTKITTGPVATDVGISPGTPAWGDLNNDGFADLIIADNGTTADLPPMVVERAVPLVYINNRDGTFRRASQAEIGPLATTAVAGGMAVWADYDNDGYLDFFQQTWLEANRLWRGGVEGRFSLVTSNVGPNIKFAGWGSWGYSWADYDRDGFLDLYVTTAWVADGTVDYLFRNKGDGTFAAPLNMGAVADSQYPCWADYDNDGDPDVLVGGFPGRLYRNDGGGTFTNVTSSAVATDPGWYAAWGDYDNDGDLDMFTTTGLYENNGAGGFRAGTGFPAGGNGAWVDIDNDGYLELYVGDWSANARRLYRFDPQTKRFNEVTLSPITADPIANANIAWADYDNNGFMDLAVASGGRGTNRLYRNNGNGNHWLHVKLIGTVSNRSAIGARVIAEAVISSQSVRQMREINGNAGSSNLRVHFGLGDATNVSNLRVEWPSGTVQELANVMADQVLTIVEHQSYTGARPAFAGAKSQTNGLQISITEPDAGARYVLEGSPDLLLWTKLMAKTSGGGTAQYTDTRAANYTNRFYRVVVP